MVFDDEDTVELVSEKRKKRHIKRTKISLFCFVNLTLWRQREGEPYSSRSNAILSRCVFHVAERLASLDQPDSLTLEIVVPFLL